MTPPTRLERKHAAKEALAILTAAHGEDTDPCLITDLIAGQGELLPVVTASIAGLASGLLKSFDDEHEGAANCWLAWVGQRVEAMDESEEA